MDSQVSQDEINSILWKACDSFRGTVDAVNYKDYILVMLFLKFISDVWRDHYAEYEKQYKGNKERILRRMERERFVLPDQSSFYYLYENREAANVGELINIALEHLEMVNKKKLLHVFQDVDFNSESRLGNTRKRNHILKNLLEDFNDTRLDLRPSRIGNLDIIGNSYEYLIGRFAAGAGKKAGEFYTPPEVSILMAKLVQPKKGERICDPACGSGSLLLKCANEVREEDYSLYGQEAINSTWALCMMNMFLHSVNNPRIERGDTLLEPRLLEKDKLMKFDVVVANPPFSLDKWGANEADAEAEKFNRWHRGVPPKNKADYAFISHMVETAVEGTGRVAVVVPHGVLFRAGSEGRIRQSLIEENLLDAVIGLPANLFFGTDIPAAILVLRKDRNENSKVLFIDASNEFNKDTGQNTIRVDKEVRKIVSIYKEKEIVAKYSYLAKRNEIVENDFNLNIPRYVDTFEEEAEIDLQSVYEERKKLKSQLTELEDEMTRHLRELGYVS